MFHRTAVASFALAAILAGSVAGCATTVPSESTSVIDGNDILTADLGTDISARGVVLAAVLLVAGDIDKGLAQGVVTPAEVTEARLAIDSGTLDMWRQRAESDGITP
ncbi:MAG: hypothetical protein NWS64_00810 [Microbacteriaceae bacterium]|nr:hypothetical protein [Microbacteriaceae bacterium]